MFFNALRLSQPRLFVACTGAIVLAIASLFVGGCGNARKAAPITSVNAPGDLLFQAPWPDADKMTATRPMVKSSYAYLIKARAIYDAKHQPTEPGYADARAAIALDAYLSAYGDRFGECLSKVTASAAKAARAAGQTDPLIVAIHYRYGNAGADALETSIDAALAAGYPASFAAQGYAQVVDQAKKTAQGSIRSGMAKWEKNFAEMVRDKEAPPYIVYLRANDILDAADERDDLEQEAARGVERVFDQFAPRHPTRHALRGEFMINWAWIARGSGYADTVTKDGWKKFRERVEIASTEGQLAYADAPTLPFGPRVMLTVAMAQGFPRAEMEKWYRRALDANPNYMSAVGKKFSILQPKWGGSPEELSAFGDQLLKQGNYAAGFPTEYCDALYELAGQVGGKENLFRQPAVWNAMETAYTGMLKVYPNSVTTRNYFARAAQIVGKYEIVDEQLEWLGHEYSPDLFGDEAQYQELRHLAKEKAGK